MSRSNPRAVNPASRFFQWGGADGTISYYDKEAEERIDVPFDKKKPFIFLVLDELNTVAGFNEAENSSIWANEVRDMSKEPFAVRTGKGLKMRGKYNDIKGELTSRSFGGKYAKSVYIAYKNDEGELTIGHIKLSGAALMAWIDFNKKWDVYKVAVKLEDIKAAKKGKVDYFVPVFAGLPVSESTNAEAGRLDDELQAYLKTYFTNVEKNVEEEIVTVQDDDEDEVEEEAVKEAPTKKKERKTVDDDDSIDIAEVPF